MDDCKENILKLSYSKQMYTREVLIKSAYAFTNKAYVHLDADADSYMVVLTAKDDQEIDLKEFENEMLAQTARQLVYEQTKDIRRLTVARAFASTIIGSTEESVVTDDEENNIDDVLKNWFDE